MKVLWGIDLGGTKIEGVIINLTNDGFEVIERLRVPTEKENGYQHIINQIVKAVNLMSEQTGLRPGTLGIGTPGANEPSTGLLKNSNTTALNGMPFKRDLEAALGFSIEMANDANCFAIAEAKLGVVREVLPNAETVFGIIMGTGVGGGVVIGNKVLNGRHGIAGEWGHNYLHESGGTCYCGKVGCSETVISGPALERYYKSQTGVHRSLKDIIAMHKDGVDPHATQAVERLLHYFGIGVSNIINLFDPDAIVLGGGLGNIDLLYNEGVQEVSKYVFNSQMTTPFLKPKLGDSAGVFGAALLVA